MGKIFLLTKHVKSANGTTCLSDADQSRAVTTFLSFFSPLHSIHFICVFCHPYLRQTLNRTTQLTAANGKNVDALVVFSLSLKYIKDKAIEIIQERTGDREYTAKDIQWVLTVPAIWTPAAKQFMREAAYQVW